ncbi:MAG: hypothetical protein COB34_01480 [Methylophilaceae bacterium]|nr:MAG: hypothetical protein COB34_01480 [Methylophilaceae bacterium]
MKPILINNLEVAKSQGKLSGEISANDCKRLADMLSQGDSNTQSIQYALVGSVTKFHLPSLHLKIDTILSVICQRCLEPMPLALTLAHHYVVNESEPDGIEAGDDFDWVETSREMDLSALIEDELLMAVPLAPTHSHACKPTKQESGEKHNPFAVLKGLVK